MNNRSFRTYLLFAPILVTVLFFFMFPLLWLLRVSFYESGASSGYGVGGTSFYIPNTFTFGNYFEFLSSSYYMSILGNTLSFTAIITVVTMIISYPFAYYIYMAKPRLKMLLIAAVLLPKLTNVLLLVYGLKIMLGNSGMVNDTLLWLGVIDQPIRLLNNTFAAVIGKVLLVAPYPILVLVAGFHALDSTLKAAAKGLGATPWQAFREVTFPLSLPSAVVGMLITIIWGLGAFISPSLLGSPKNQTLAVEIPKQTFENVNWAMGSTVAFMMVLLVLIVVLLQSSIVNYFERPRTAPTTSSGLAANNGTVRTYSGGETIPLPARSPRVAHVRDMVIKWAYHIFAALVVFYFMAPIVVTALVSFTPGNILEIPTDEFSLRWYVAFFESDKWVSALWNSIYVGSFTVILSVGVGLTAALGFSALGTNKNSFIYTVALLPIYTPGVIIGMSLLAFSQQMGIWGTYFSISLGHMLWSFPLVIMVLKVSIDALDAGLNEASRGLGASRFTTFREITLPLIAPALFVSALFTFIISLNEFVMTLFLTTVETETLPRLIWPTLRFSLTPLTAAASGVLLIITIVLLMVVAWVIRIDRFIDINKS
ncbi:Binding-protein-dependent transport system inner membrane component [Roseovarius lutimaris]|uniref:Binding-protein-dependent transport system inner membrane component n=1 Tax=Roseovarius lutimaris TaxID=1005928 RepID=A0A1I5GQ35_9RHOB|nr:ABC transporter permease subunit [Roseovarius lutimaris]SFO38037.1 Binding-protein-dependent transport system inner membrane component [Roseovarius lutimaris]